jgi:hypothetical protein
VRRFKACVSPGTVLGTIALIVALSGTGYAASGAGSSNRSQGHPGEGASASAKKHPKHNLSRADVRRIAADEIKKAAPKLSVAHANTADKATNADTATTATRATSATSADTATRATIATNADTATRATIATNVFSADVRSDGSLLGSIPTGATSSRAALGDYRVSFGRSIAGCTIAATLASNTGPQLGMVGVGVIDSTTLQVFTRDEANTVADRGFYVQAICPS